MVCEALARRNVLEPPVVGRRLQMAEQFVQMPEPLAMVKTESKSPDDEKVYIGKYQLQAFGNEKIYQPTYKYV